MGTYEEWRERAWKAEARVRELEAVQDAAIALCDADDAMALGPSDPNALRGHLARLKVAANAVRMQRIRKGIERRERLIDAAPARGEVMLALPRTRLGWLRLWRIARRRCIVCGKRTLMDPWRDVGGVQGRVCLACGGVIHPRGVLEALSNEYAARRGEK